MSLKDDSKKKIYLIVKQDKIELNRITVIAKTTPYKRHGCNLSPWQRLSCGRFSAPHRL